MVSTFKDLKFRPPEVMEYPRGAEITPAVVQGFIGKHQQELPRYKYMVDMYKGLSEINNLKPKDNFKPDNRLSVNFAKYIVDVFTGYFNGIPIKKTHSDEKIRDKIIDFDNRNDIEDQESELAKMAAIYGRSYELVYQNEYAETRVTYTSPLNMFLVYDTSIKQKPLFAVYYSISEVDNKKVFNGTLYTSELTIDLTGEPDNIEFGSEYLNPYGRVPVVEYVLNEERMGLFESAIPLMNSFNKALSEKANDVDYFADQYLLFLGADVDEEDLKEIKSTKVINYHSESDKQVDVRFLDKPDSDGQTENLLDRLYKMIFQTAMVSNISDENFGQSTGIALAYKQEAMSNQALAFQRKFQSSLNTRYKLYCSLATNVPTGSNQSWKEIEYKFTRNIPKNIKEEAETALLLKGITSEETALNVLSIIPDAVTELKKIADEQKPLDLYKVTDEPDNEKVDQPW